MSDATKPSSDPETPDAGLPSAAQSSSSAEAAAKDAGGAPAGSPAPEAEGVVNEPTLDESEGVLQRIRRLPVPEKIHLALTGTREERVALIRDANRSVSKAVIESPKVSESEAEIYAGLPDVAEEVYRLISKNLTFMKHSGVVRALVNNPRVPLDITLPLVKRLKGRELRDLKNNRNLATALRTLAAKMLTPR